MDKFLPALPLLWLLKIQHVPDPFNQCAKMYQRQRQQNQEDIFQAHLFLSFSNKSPLGISLSIYKNIGIDKFT